MKFCVRINVYSLIIQLYNYSGSFFFTNIKKKEKHAKFSLFMYYLERALLFNSKVHRRQKILFLVLDSS